MEKKQRIRYEIAQATRNVRTGSTKWGGQAAQMDLIEHKYNLSSDGVGGTRAMSMFISDGYYWEPLTFGIDMLEGVKIGELTSATNAGP